MNALQRYAHWLHLRWPAGRVEKLPVVREDGSTNVPGLYVVGDLRGVPLLKFSADTGAKAIRTIAAEPSFAGGRVAGGRIASGRGDGARGDGGDGGPVLDVAIIGAGVGGMSAALEAREMGLRFGLYEAAEPFSTIENFPKGKPIFTYPKEMVPEGRLTITAEVKEELVAELRAQTVEAGIEPTPARVERVERSGQEFVVTAAGETIRARRVVVALGRSGNFRRMNVPGEDLDKVYNRLHDPKDFCGQRALVVGGGDSALETAIALATCGAEATLSYRKTELSRPKPENIERVQALAADRREGQAGSIRMRLGTNPKEIREHEVVLKDSDGHEETLPNDVVFAMIGREPPLDFFRRSGVAVLGDTGARFWATLVAMVAFIGFLYHWKAGGKLTAWFEANQWFPFAWTRPEDPSTWLGGIALSFSAPAAWFTLLYTLAIVIFGVRRIRRRNTPYVTRQTLVLMAVQAIPLFVLPSVVLPVLGHQGHFGDAHRVETLAGTQVQRWDELVAAHGSDESGASLTAAARDAGLLPAGVGDWPELRTEISWPHRREGDRILLHGAGGRLATVRLSDARVHVSDPTGSSPWVVDQLFPASEWDPHGREYWRAIGLVLAWPLFLWNVFTHQPMTLWLVIGFLQTFVFIPAIIYFWGKGAYCGWICSCGGLAETLGDEHRHKMPHGPVWNRLNLAGQVILAICFVMLGLRVAGWMLPWDHPVNALFVGMLEGKTVQGSALPIPLLNYKWFVDLFLAGVLGTGLYFHYSGRVWCRFFCPLAALMHVFARFSRFRILADKKKCISCNVCTSVCHQGIDIMNFANKGLPLEDPECVRCSACVQSCPTGVLSFGQVDRKSGDVIAVDSLVASAVQWREGTVRHR